MLLFIYVCLTDCRQHWFFDKTVFIFFFNFSHHFFIIFPCTRLHWFVNQFWAHVNTRYCVDKRCVCGRELMMSNSHLTVPVLDVLTNLNLTADLLAEVHFFRHLLPSSHWLTTAWNGSCADCGLLHIARNMIVIRPSLCASKSYWLVLFWAVLFFKENFLWLMSHIFTEILLVFFVLYLHKIKIHWTEMNVIAWACWLTLKERMKSSELWELFVFKLTNVNVGRSRQCHI